MHATNTDTLLETLVARTIGDESGLSMNALLAAPVPPGILRFLRAEIVTTLAEDLTRAPHFARVASPTAGPDTLRDALLTHAAGQYIFPREEFLEMLENAARFTENYLCRPRWTLASFLFVDQPAITTETLLRKLEYITDYAYLPQLMRRVVTQSGKQVLTANECIAMIARIDDAILREHSPRELALLTKPIFQFYLLSEDVEGRPIALRALLLFLEDKRLDRLREYVEGVWHIRGKYEITLQEFVGLSEDFASGHSLTEPEPAATAPPAEHPAETAESAPPATGSADATLPHETRIEESPLQENPVDTLSMPEPAPAEVLPEMEPIQESLPFEIPPPVHVAEQPVEPPPQAPEAVTTELAPVEEPETLGPAVQEPATQEPAAEEPAPPETPVLESPDAEAAAGEPPSPPPAPEVPALPTLTEAIPADLRRRFINVICGKDAEFYDLVIARLDEMHSWTEASAYIRELFEINKIDPFNETAIAFTDLVQQRCDRPGVA